MKSTTTPPTPGDYERSVVKAVTAVTTNPTVHSATVYYSPTLVFKATRRGKPDARDKRTELVLTIGRPNWADRKFIKLCVKAGEPFPVKRVQLRLYREKRAGKR